MSKAKGITEQSKTEGVNGTGRDGEKGKDEMDKRMQKRSKSLLNVREAGHDSSSESESSKKKEKREKKEKKKADKKEKKEKKEKKGGSRIGRGSRIRIFGGGNTPRGNTIERNEKNSSSGVTDEEGDVVNGKKGKPTKIGESSDGSGDKRMRVESDFDRETSPPKGTSPSKTNGDGGKDRKGKKSGEEKMDEDFSISSTGKLRTRDARIKDKKQKEKKEKKEKKQMLKDQKKEKKEKKKADKNKGKKDEAERKEQAKLLQQSAKQESREEKVVESGIGGAGSGVSGGGGTPEDKKKKKGSRLSLRMRDKNRNKTDIDSYASGSSGPETGTEDEGLPSTGSRVRRRRGKDDDKKQKEDDEKKKQQQGSVAAGSSPIQNSTNDDPGGASGESKKPRIKIMLDEVLANQSRNASSSGNSPGKKQPLTDRPGRRGSDQSSDSPTPSAEELPPVNPGDKSPTTPTTSFDGSVSAIGASRDKKASEDSVSAADKFDDGGGKKKRRSFRQGRKTKSLVLTNGLVLKQDKKGISKEEVNSIGSFVTPMSPKRTRTVDPNTHFKVVRLRLLL